MNWWRRFLKKRRQSDRVKLQIICFLLGMFFLGDFLYRCAGVWQSMQSPVEYILSHSAGIVGDSVLSELRALDNVKTAGRQQEMTVTFTEKDKTVTMDCVMLSGDYMETAYGIQTGSGSTFFLNQAAWEQLEDSEENQRQVSYSLSMAADSASSSGTGPSAGDGETEGGENNASDEGKESVSVMAGTGSQTGTAGAVLAETLPDTKACAFLAGNTAQLSGGNEVRVQLSGQDLDGMNQKHLTALGFTVVNSGDLELEELQREIQFMRMRYDALLAVTFLFVAFGILKKRRYYHMQL